MSNWGDPNRPAGSDRSAAQSQGQQPYAQPPQYGQNPSPTAYGQQPAFGPAPVPPFGQAPAAPPYTHAQPPGHGSADRAFHVAQLDAMHRSADRQAVLIRWVLGIVLLVFVFLRTAGDGVGGVAFGGALIVAMAAAFFVGAVISRRLTGQRHSAVLAARPGADVIEVWGARGLHGALRAAGITPTKVRKSAATSLSMVPSAQGVELWTGRGSTAAVLVAVPWSAVVAVDESRGSITNDGTRPALMLVTAIGQRLLLVPRRRSNGGRVVGVPELRALVARLEELRLSAGR